MSDATSTEIGAFRVPRKELRRQLVIVVSLLLVVTAAIASLFIVQGVNAQISDVQHTYEVRRQVGELVQALTDAETGQRGFLLTQDPAYLEPYQQAVSSLDSIYRNLMTLAGDSPDQKVRIGSVAESIEQKRAEMATTITMAGDGRLPEALSILRTDAGRTLMAGIRETLGALIAEEDAKLIERNSGVDGARRWLVVTIILALGGAAILTYTLLTMSQRQMRNLTQTSNELASMNAELESRVQARTVELEEARAHAERERARVELLLQDTNHRIGNSLATVSSLLGLQVTRSRSYEVKAALESAQNRVHAIASGHRRLRLGSDLETVNAAEFLESVIDDLEETQAAAAWRSDQCRAADHPQPRRDDAGHHRRGAADQRVETLSRTAAPGRSRPASAAIRAGRRSSSSRRRAGIGPAALSARREQGDDHPATRDAVRR